MDFGPFRRPGLTPAVLDKAVRRLRLHEYSAPFQLTLDALGDIPASAMDGVFQVPSDPIVHGRVRGHRVRCVPLPVHG
jgi:hypothetical protein